MYLHPEQYTAHSIHKKRLEDHRGLGQYAAQELPRQLPVVVLM